MSMKNFNDAIGNRTRDLPACSAVPQPTAPPRASVIENWWDEIQAFGSAAVREFAIELDPGLVEITLPQAVTLNSLFMLSWSQFYHENGRSMFF